MRANKLNDSRKWTAVEMLEELIDQIKAGEAKPRQIVVQWFEDHGENHVGPHRMLASNCTWMDHLTLLKIGEHELIERLRG